MVEIRVFILKGVIDVGVGREKVLELGFLKGRHVLFPQQLKQTLFTHSPYIISGVPFRFIYNPEVDAGSVKHPSQRLRDLLERRMVAGVFAQVPQPFHRLFAGVLGFEIQGLRPHGTLSFGLAERIAVTRQVAKRFFEVFVNLSPLHQTSAQIHHNGHVLIQNGTALGARQTGGATPELLGGDQAPDQGRFSTIRCHPRLAEQRRAVTQELFL
jgi:hypothetical protein